MRWLKYCSPVVLLVFSSQTWAGFSVFTCEPEWAALVSEIGGEHVDVYSATTAFQDPHYIQARPSLISKVRRADLMVCTGAELEQGWLPVLQSRSGNAKIQSGTDGVLFMAESIELKGKPVVLDRGHGHIHAAGNPHVHTDPNLMLKFASALVERLQQLDPDNREAYRVAYDSFDERMQASIKQWQAKSSSLDGKKMITHHSYWQYLMDWLGVDVIAKLEPLPGVQPTVAHLSSLKATYADQAEAIIRVNYSEARGAEWLSSNTGLPIKVLPSTVDFQGGQTLFEWYDTLIEVLRK